MKKDSDLFYTCSLIEYIGRKCKLKRSAVIDKLGIDVIKRIYKYAGTLHCEPIDKVADDYIEMQNIGCGTYDNVEQCKYEVPDYWTIGEVYSRLIEDVCETDLIETLIQVYTSWISDSISNYNSDFFFQSRDYIEQCYRNNQIL